MITEKKIAFSVAEAMVALLIGSIALGAAAPLITKQIKHNNSNGALEDVINDRLDEIERRLPPAGSIIFLDSNRHNGCPDGWTMINQNGKFFKITTNAANIGTSEDAKLPDHMHAIGSYKIAGVAHSQSFYVSRYKLLANNNDSALKRYTGAANGVSGSGDVNFEEINSDSETNTNTAENAQVVDNVMEFTVDNGLTTSLNIFNEFTYDKNSYAEPTNNFDIQPQSYLVYACKQNS